MPRQQPKLHEAMRLILSEQPNRTASLDNLYAENVRQDLYRQNRGDGPHAPPYQFKLRTLHLREFQFIPPDKIMYVGK